jgi:hypothetical protein
VRSVAGRFAILLAVAGCATPADDAPFRISNVRQGLARVESLDRGAIYAEGTTFRVVPNDECPAAGKIAPCMWFAVAFDYESSSEVTTLACATAFDKPTEVVDVDKSLGRRRGVSGPITLKGKSGTAFWPAYLTTDDQERPGRLTTRCLLEGREVLRISFTFR